MSKEKADEGGLRPRSRKTLTEEQRRRIFCVKHGHSRLRDYCFGYHHCARCGDQLGDSLGGVYRDDTAVYVGHMHIATHDPKRFKGYRAEGCECPENAEKLTKTDLALVPRWNSSGEEQRPPWGKRHLASNASAAESRPQEDPP